MSPRRLRVVRQDSRSLALAKRASLANEKKEDDDDDDEVVEVV